MAGLCRLRLRVMADRVVELQRDVASHEVVACVLRWLEEEGFGEWARKLEAGDEEVELVDSTTYPERVVRSWSVTLQTAGFWPSARLVARNAACYHLRVRSADPNAGEAIVTCRPDEEWHEVAARAFSALPRALPLVRAFDARRCRLMFDDKLLGGRVEESSVPRRGAVVVLREPAAAAASEVPTPGLTTASSTRSREQPATATCRICLAEEVVRPTGEDAANPEEEWAARLAETARRVGTESLAEAWQRVKPRPPRDRLFSPCLCNGTMHYVHRSCLDRWRASAPARSRFRCDQCGYEYRVRRTALSSFLDSEAGALAVAVALLAVAVQTTGAALLGSLDAEHKRVLYHSLRVAPTSRFAQVATLGSAAVGLACFALYAFENLLSAYNQHRLLGVRFDVAAEPSALLFLWIAAETLNFRRTRALAVIGFAICARVVFHRTMRVARGVAARLGDVVLDIHS